MIRHLGNTYATTNFLRIAIYTKMNKFDAAFAIIENVLNFAKLGRARRKPTLGLHLVSFTIELISLGYRCTHNIINMDVYFCLFAFLSDQRFRRGR